MSIVPEKIIAVDTARPLDEEAWNTATHGVGFLLSLAGAGVLLGQAAGRGIGTVAAVLAFVVSMAAVYGVSTLSHFVQRPRAKYWLQAWDQGLIYFLIVGTYTPFLWVLIPQPLGWIVLALMWAAALVGFVSKVVWQQRVTQAFSTASYIALGWLPGLVLAVFVSPACLAWTFAGGVSYTVGTLFLVNDRRHRLFHSVWHVLVIAGSGLHYYAIFVHVLA